MQANISFVLMPFSLMLHGAHVFSKGWQQLCVFLIVGQLRSFHIFIYLEIKLHISPAVSLIGVAVPSERKEDPGSQHERGPARRKKTGSTLLDFQRTKTT